jgi:hypothetical protein
MSERRDPDTAELLAELTQTLRELQAEVEPDRRLRPPTPGELARFTSEIAIPGIILVLRTNIRVLELLQRTLRMADGRSLQTDGTLSGARERAEQAGSAALAGLDDALVQLQSAVDGRAENERTAELLERAQELRTEVQRELDTQSDPVDIDVDAELQAIKDDLDDADGSDSDTGDENAPDPDES